MVVGGPVFSHQYFSHGVPGAEPTCVTDGWWWMVDGGWGQKRFFNFAETLHTFSS